MGKFIDSCDIVVRFNRYSINGYEKYVGSKTTVWCYFANTWEVSSRPVERVNEVWVVRQFHFPLEPERMADAKRRKAKLWNIPDDWIFQLRKLLGHAFPSTGIIGLYAAMRKYRKYRVPIYAQGLGQLNLDLPWHYFDTRKIDKELKHNGRAETRLINQWREEGKVHPWVSIL